MSDVGIWVFCSVLWLMRVARFADAAMLISSVGDIEMAYGLLKEVNDVWGCGVRTGIWVTGTFSD